MKAMKASLFLALLILAAGGLLGWKQHDRLVVARETHRLAVADARALGLSPESLLEDGKPPLPTKSGRTEAADKIAAARDFAAELIAFAKEMKEIEKSGEQPGADMQKRIMETLARFLDLGPAEIKAVIAELKDSPDLDDEMRRGIIGFSIMMLANDQPEAALSIFTESSDIKGIGDMGEHVVASALRKWGEQDPLRALAWIRANSEKHAKLVTDETKAAIIGGAAKQDPKLALSLIGELEFKERHRIAGNLAESARTAEERTALLAALRADPKHADLLRETLGSMGSTLAREGFDSAEAWLSTAGLDEAETTGIAESLSHWQTGGDTGKWIEWMDGKVPAETMEQKTGELVRQWTRKDFKAAGEWINGLADGTVKTTAVKSFATTVAPYEPESAEQWAKTLPPGKERDELLESIRRQKKPANEGDMIWSEPDGE